MVYRFGRQDRPGAPHNREVTGVGDVTGTVGTIAGVMNNVAMTITANIAGLAPTVPANNVDPHVLTGTAAPIWRTLNVMLANMSGTLPSTVTCLPPQYAWSTT